MIGVIGLGNMGHAVARRLLAEGESLTVWNRTSRKADDLDNVTVAKTPAELVAASDVILSILGNDAATQSVYFDSNGIVSTELSGKVIVDMCTMAPPRAKELEAAVLSKQGLFLECPVGGTIGPALEGKLLGLAGGTDKAYAAASPVLQKLTRRLEHFGPVGTGAAMKLAVNLPLMVYWSALGEALEIAASHNIDTSQALDVLADSSGAIGVAKMRVPLIRSLLEGGDSGSTNFSLENAIKDMEIMIATATEHSTRADVISSALKRYQQAEQQGFDGLDCSLVTALDNRQ